MFQLVYELKIIQADIHVGPADIKQYGLAKTLRADMKKFQAGLAVFRPTYKFLANLAVSPADIKMVRAKKGGSRPT